MSQAIRVDSALTAWRTCNDSKAYFTLHFRAEGGASKPQDLS